LSRFSVSCVSVFGTGRSLIPAGFLKMGSCKPSS
jgi:hypothetical protein